MKREFEKYSEHNVGDVVTVQQIIKMSQEHQWTVHSMDSIGHRQDIKDFECWIGSLCADGAQGMLSDITSLRIDWDLFQRIVYRIWYREFIERSIQKQFKSMFPDYRDDANGDDHSEQEMSISVDQLATFVENMTFGLNGPLIRAEDKVLKMCYQRVDDNGSGGITFPEMLCVLQHLSLYAMSEWSLRYRYAIHSVEEEMNKQRYLHKEDFMAISKRGLLVFANDLYEENENDALVMVKVCNSTSFLSGLFDKFASPQYRGDTVPKMTFDAFSTAFLYRMLMELSCFYIDDICELSFDETEDGKALVAEYEDYYPVLQTLGFVDDRDRRAKV